MQGRCPVQENWTFLNDVFQYVPDVIVFTVDLSDATVTSSSASAPFNWATAATLSGGNFTSVTSGCSGLPVATLQTGTMWNDWTHFIQITDNLMANPWLSPTCT